MLEPRTALKDSPLRSSGRGGSYDNKKRQSITMMRCAEVHKKNKNKRELLVRLKDEMYLKWIIYLQDILFANRHIRPLKCIVSLIFVHGEQNRESKKSFAAKIHEK